MSDLAIKAPTAKSKKGWFTIVVSLGNDNESVRQFVGADGKDFLITRGKEVDVPPEVMHILDCAVVMVDEQDPDNENKSVAVARKRFPYTIVKAL